MKAAIDDGDKDAMAKAISAMTKANGTINELEKWRYNDEQRNLVSQTPVAQQPIYDDSIRMIAEEWLEDHPYLQQDSKRYDPVLAKKVINFVNNYDKELQATNRGHELLSDEYFEVVENYITKVRHSAQKTSRNIESMPTVGGVRNSYSTNNNSSKPAQLTLTAEEKQLAHNFGMTEKEWLIEKIKESKNQR